MILGYHHYQPVFFRQIKVWTPKKIWPFLGLPGSHINVGLVVLIIWLLSLPWLISPLSSSRLAPCSWFSLDIFTFPDWTWTWRCPVVGSNYQAFLINESHQGCKFRLYLIYLIVFSQDLHVGGGPGLKVGVYNILVSLTSVSLWFLMSSTCWWLARDNDFLHFVRKEKSPQGKQKDVCESVGHPKSPVKMLVWIYELELDESAARNAQ